MTLFPFGLEMRKHSHNHKQAAFTLLELLITLSISITLVVTAVPNFGAFIAKNHLNAKSSELRTTLSLARTYALTNQSIVIVCAASDHTMTNCITRPKRNTNWQYGWLAYADNNQNNVLDAADTIIKAQENNRSTAIVFNQNGLLRFFPDGHARSAGFYLCEPNSTKGVHLRLLYTGRARLSTKLSARRRDLCISSL